MALFKISNQILTKILPLNLTKEREIQKLFERNLVSILNVDFLATEYSTSFGGRIDSLGIDKAGCPVIIEYKLTQNDNVINQGLSYLKWLLDHKADFELLCKSKNISSSIDWTYPRVICVAESYNKFDLDTVELLPIKIELLRYKLYDDNILQLESENQKIVKISTAKIFEKSKKEKLQITKLQKEYLIEDHIKKGPEEIKSIFFNLREMITSLDEDITEEPKKYYIAYKLATNFVDIEIRSKDLKVFLNIPSGKLNDPFNIARDLTKPKPIGHWGNGDYETLIKNKADLNKVFDLIKQSYNYNK